MEQVTSARAAPGRHGFLRAIAISLLLTAAPLAAQSQASIEYRVKAAYLLNFAKFVDWPPSDSPVTICVIGGSPFYGMLRQVVQGETVGSREIAVEHHDSAPRQGCSVAFFPGQSSETERMLETLGPGVLTVGDDAAFLRKGGIIAFVIENRRVRFDVNQKSARRRSVRLSSRLLSVARAVEK